MRTYLTGISGARLREHYASGAWESTTLLDIVLRRAEHAPHAPAVRDASHSLDNAEYLHAVTCAAGLLGARGVGAGDVVLLQLRNGAAYAIAQVAVAALGAVLVPVKTSMMAGEMAVVADRVGARTAVIATEFADRRRDLSGRGLLVLTDDDLPAARTDVAATVWRPDDSPADADEPLNLMFSSGTTGVPKGIINTTNTQLSCVRALIDELPLGTSDSWLVVPPMAHNAGWLYSFMPALLSGAGSVFQERFDARRTLELLTEHSIRNVFLTPTHAVDVLAAIEDGAAAPEPLQRVVIGGAATTPELKAALRTQLGVVIVSMYGSTENQGATFVRPGDDPARADSTVGRPCPGMSVTVLASDRHTVLPAGEVGEIATRGPGNFAGYYDDQAATDAAMNRDGWFLTGDLGLLDEEGFLRITGRHKELIIRGGMNITPDDVEQALADHPALDRVAAVGIPDERLGEVVCAVVVADGEVTLSSLTEHLRARGVGTHLWPEALLRIAEFPVTDLGKVQRGRLRELAGEAVKRNAVERAAPRQVPAQNSH